MSRDLRAPIDPPWPAYAAWRAQLLTAVGAGVSRPGVSPALLSVPAGSVPAMAKSSAAPAFQCAECGWRTTKWSGRCGECQAWGTVEQVATRVARATVFGGAALAGLGCAGPGLGAGATGWRRWPGRAVLDGVGLGGPPPPSPRPARRCPSARWTPPPRARARPGWTSWTGCWAAAWCGAVVLLAGEPGVGKSTLLLEAGAHAAAAGPVLYITGEESAAQVRLRADRIGAVAGNLYLAAETDLAALLGHVAAVRPRLLIVDSVQTITMDGVDGAPGGVSQIRAVTAALIAVAKQHARDHGAGRARDQGRVHRRAARPGTPGGRGAALRGRPARPVPHGPGAEEPVRPDRRDRLLRPRRAGDHRAARPERPVPHPPAQRGARHVRDRHAGGPPAAAQRGADAGRAVRAWTSRAGSPPGWTPPGSAWSSRCCPGAPTSSSASRTSTRPPWAGSGSASRPWTWPWRWPWPARWWTSACPARVVAIGEVGLAGEVRRVTGVQRRLAEAERMGFRLAIVPAGSAQAAAAHARPQKALPQRPRPGGSTCGRSRTSGRRWPPPSGG